ncbi:nucleoside-diphosphate kinase [SAR202 cluster bacterium AD-802-E10_MRT_200m]|nr:nucleoside-diphosphate kinase [SAR202 cluster bacterium AD-802-E10_MRT_200m]MQF83101.1 nucleoside-diphosphate kinase [SAR202 cluster bacterium AD-802-E10_MRT_200m]
MSNKERTLVLVKPDAVQRGLTGTIIQRLENRGLKIIGLKFLQLTRELANKHYAAHQDKPFFPGLVNFITSGPITAIALEGENAVEAVRQTMGVTDPIKASSGTIRGDFGLNIGRNLIHGSDSPESAISELSIYFQADELTDWNWAQDNWVTES